jgi:hypothetical protein
VHNAPWLSSVSRCLGPTQRRGPVSSSIGGQPHQLIAQRRPITASSATLADFSRARDSQITFSVTHGWSAFWRGRPWFAERRIGETSLAVGSSRFWIGWVTRHGDKCARSTCRDWIGPGDRKSIQPMAKRLAKFLRAPRDSACVRRRELDHQSGHCGSARSQHAGIALMLRMDCILVIVAAR